MEYPQQSSLVRFRLRTLLIAVLVLAIVLMLVGPLVRQLNEQRQLRLLLFVLAALAGSTLIVAVVCTRRYSVERRCGQRVCVLPLDSKRKGLVGSVAMAGGALMTASACAVPLVIYEPPNPSQFGWMFPHLIYFVVAMSGAQFAQAVFWICWRRAFTSLEICRHGIVKRGLTLVNWSSVSVDSWDSSTGKLVLYLNRFVEVLAVSPDQRERLSEVLTAHVAPTGPF